MPETPLRPAASLVLVSRAPAVRLLWVKRAEANPFLGGFHSFPGGRVSREDGPTEEEALETTMMRCAVRETFEETGMLVGLQGQAPPSETQRTLREQLLNGNVEFWPSMEGLGLSLDRAALLAAGRWITPPFSRMRFNTMFCVAEIQDPRPPDVWPGELESGEWIDPREALRLWDEDRVALAMPALHAIQVIAAAAAQGAGGSALERLAAGLAGIPEANGVPSRHVILHPGIVMVPLRTETLLPATHTNAVVVGDRDLVVIDPGTADPSDLAPLFEVVDAALKHGASVKAILLTHRHKDHLLGAELLRGRWKAPVWGHPSISDRVRLDRELTGGERIELQGPHPRRLLAVPTPGHSKSHVAFFEERSRTLIAGDLVSTLGTVVINPPDGNMGEYMRSLERVRELGAQALLPGHGPPSRGVDHLIEALIEHRRQRESRILRALEGGPMTEETLREEVYKDTPGAAAELAARTLEAHLEKLIEEGKVRKEGGRVILSTP
ncbi:MAG: MBL fold metallo-hydrolase [Candidatus Eisenbacteria bacterium]|uniref:MBL fold metallo-hydrolase n=1 Tax=Eiseniibacteriota bacterium TaxID=2212470 RepID=A0A538S7R8_UNCEI|nr:MAG: MBL fold metallo-hydrolase [Candidatus Eisenbacteria bacterium]